MNKKSTDLFQLISQLTADGVDLKSKEAEIWQVFGQQVAVIVMDAAGFSRVSQSHGILHFLSKLVRLHEVIQPVMEKHNCGYRNATGDNVIAAFDNVDAAIRCGLEMHKVIAEEKIMLTADEPFRVCMGIGWGQMLYSENPEGYFSSEMNFASKLGEDTAEGGQTLLTQSAFSAASAELASIFSQAEATKSGVNLTYYIHQS